MSFFLSIVVLTNLFCVSFAQEDSSIYKRIDDYWCNDSSYSCSYQYGDVCVNGKLKCGDDDEQNAGEACLTLIYAYCNADPKCKAFQRSIKWSGVFYFPCSTQEEQEWKGAMMFVEEMEDTPSLYFCSEEEDWVGAEYCDLIYENKCYEECAWDCCGGIVGIVGDCCVDNEYGVPCCSE